MVVLYIVSAERPVHVSDLKRSWKKNLLQGRTSSANLNVSLCKCLLPAFLTPAANVTPLKRLTKTNAKISGGLYNKRTHGVAHTVQLVALLLIPLMLSSSRCGNRAHAPTCRQVPFQKLCELLPERRMASVATLTVSYGRSCNSCPRTA